MLVLVADFSSLTACEGESIQLRCPRAQFIAIRSVVFGWSNTFHMQSKCARGRLPSAADHGMLCPRMGDRPSWAEVRTQNLDWVDHNVVSSADNWPSLFLTFSVPCTKLFSASADISGSFSLRSALL